MPSIKVDEWMRTTLGIPLGYFAPVHSDVRFVRAEVTLYQRQTFFGRCTVPWFVTYSDTADPGDARICGTAWFACQCGNSTLAKRIPLCRRLEAAIRALRAREFEVLVSRLVEAAHGEASVTPSSRDAGRDVLGVNTKSGDLVLEKLKLGLGGRDPIPWLITASCKHTIGGGTLSSRAVPPAFIRELVGTWAIERWTEFATPRPRYLASPVTALFATTRRLAEDSWILCGKCGVEVMSLPDVVLALCRYAPDGIIVSDRLFSSANFKTWVAG